MISLTLDPFTARGYAAMHGGEAEFRKAGNKAQHVPMNQRAVFVFDIPTEWIKANMDPRFGGNVGSAAGKLSDREQYEQWTGSDTEYYQLTEFRVSKAVPPRFIKGYMLTK
jgi:hypothetical protein